MHHSSHPSGARITPVEPVEYLDSAAMELGNRLLRLVPSRDAEHYPGIAGAVDALLGTRHEIFFHGIDVVRGDELPKDLGASFATEFWLPPDPEIGVATIDQNVTEHWLETLLDDEPPTERRLSPVTPRDFGLVTFVLLHVVDTLKQEGFPPITLSTESPGAHDPLAAVRDVERVAQAVFGVTSQRSGGLIRLFVPVGMIQSLESFARPDQRARSSFSRLRASHPGLEVGFECAVGSTMLTPSELDYLKLGDVILPDRHGLASEEVDDPCDVVVLGHGGDSDWGWTGRVRASEGGTWTIDIHEYSQRQDQDMSQDVVEEDQTEMIEQANVRVEFGLGHITLPLAELGDLKSGYVLETDREVGDGVDIVTSGRKVATGELVSIDGRLGIRVVSVEN